MAYFIIIIFKDNLAVDRLSAGKFDQKVYVESLSGNLTCSQLINQKINSGDVRGLVDV